MDVPAREADQQYNMTCLSQIAQIGKREGNPADRSTTVGICKRVDKSKLTTGAAMAWGVSADPGLGRCGTEAEGIKEGEGEGERGTKGELRWCSLLGGLKRALGLLPLLLHR